MNSIFIDGRLTRDANVGTTKNGKPVTKFRIAYNKWNKVKQAEETSFFNVTTYKELNIPKGTLVNVEGSLDSYEYTDDSGKKVTFTYITAFRVTAFNPISLKNLGQNNPFGYEEPAGNVEKAKAVFSDDIPF